MSSFSGERSPKRPRLESYSPASPPTGLEPKSFSGNPPHTPPPSVRMSPSWHAQSLSSQPLQSQTGAGSNAAFSTPPSTAGFPSQMAARSVSSEGEGDSGQPTPATEADGDAEMTDRKDEGAAGHGAIDEAEHRRTDHERQGGGGGGGGDAAVHAGVASLYCLSTAPIVPSQPHPSQDLLGLYDLRKIQASVARRDPVTGEKINKLRKSYEGKVKLLGLEGRNKAQPNQKDLEGLVDPGWDNQTPDNISWWQASLQGVELGNEAVEKDVLLKLDAALSFEPGRLPGREHDQWKSTLGLDDVAIAASGARGMPATHTAGRPTAAINAIAKTGPEVGMRNSAPASPKSSLHRPDRQGKKRRYDESSYSGYQEGFDDDGYSTGGMDDTGRRNTGSMKRQKRKDFPSSATNSPAFSSNTGNNSNMVGIRSS